MKTIIDTTNGFKSVYGISLMFLRNKLTKYYAYTGNLACS